MALVVHTFNPGTPVREQGNLIRQKSLSKKEKEKNKNKPRVLAMQTRGPWFEVPALCKGQASSLCIQDFFISKDRPFMPSLQDSFQGPAGKSNKNKLQFEYWLRSHIPLFPHL